MSPRTNIFDILSAVHFSVGIHATNILSVSHAAHCGRRPRVSPQQTIVFWLSKPFSFKDLSFKGQATGGRTPSYVLPFFISLILRADPCCIRLSPTPMQQILLFTKVFKCSKALQPIFFLLSQFFNKFKARSHFLFSNLFSRSLTTYDQILHQI